MQAPRLSRASVLLAASVALTASGCAGGAAGPGASRVGGLRAPSPGPRAEDAIDDTGLATIAALVEGRGGDDAARAELRLITAQVRAFVVAAVHAMPLGPTHAGAANTPRFDPPATLSHQLGAPAECEHGGEAHACAERLATRLVERINVLVPPHELAHVKDALLTAMAVLEESRVPVATSTRWHVLRDGDDPAAHLAQALTLVVISRHVGECVASRCSASQAGHLAAALAEELAIGPCSDALEQVLSATDEATERAAVAGLAQHGCAPACARGALSGRSDEPFDDAARACSSERTPVVFAPFADAAHEIAAWRLRTRERLAPVEAHDVAVREVLAGRADLPATTVLPLAPALFWAGNGHAIALPVVHEGGGRGVSGGTAGLVVEVPRDGDVLIDHAPRFALDASVAATLASSTPLTGLHAALARAEGEGETAPRAVALAADTPAPRIASVLEQSARGTEGPASVVELAVRRGAGSRYVALRITPGSTRVLRVNERQIAVLENGITTRIVDLVPPTEGQPDTLNGALGAEGAPVEYAIQLEPDATGATLVRVADALAVAGGRGTPTVLPAFLATLADGALVSGVTDAARATALRTAVDAHRAEALHCLDAIAAGDAAGGLPPRVDLHLVTDARGRVTQATAASLSARDEHAARCVQTAARRWRLPAPGAVAEVRVPYVRLATTTAAH